MNPYFNLKRFLQLLRLEFLSHYKTIIVGTGMWLGVSVLFALLRHHQSLPSGFLELPGLLLPFLGLLFTSQIFYEMQNPQKTTQFLTLPASLFEKLLVKWLYSGIFFFFAAYLLVFLFFKVTPKLIHAPEFNRIQKYLVKNNIIFLVPFVVYLLLHSVFFLGATYFKRQVFIRTLLSALLIVLGTFAVFYFGAWLLFRNSGLMHPGDLFALIEIHPLAYFIRILFLTGIAPLCWFIAWLRLKEKEC